MCSNRECIFDGNEKPQKDHEYIRWYPPTLEPMVGEHVWQDDFTDDREKEIAFYIHIPFCQSICKYCPFTKYSWKKEIVEKYLKLLKNEISMTLSSKYFNRSKFVAGYLGGGTPTTLSIEQLIDLTKFCQEHFNYTNDIEMSIEANPDTVDLEKLKTLISLGYNRISFGAQSFDDKFLETIGRTHKAAHTKAAVQLAQKAGFSNICVDLLYKIPGQTLMDWEHALMQAIELGISHISTYPLFIPRGTALYKQASEGDLVAQPNDELEEIMYHKTQEILGKAGFIQYTAYDFALSGKESLHHEINWKAPQGDYCSFGAGAFSHINNHIYCNYAGIESYLSKLEQGRLPIAAGKNINVREKMSRYMVLGVKCLRIPKKPFKQEFGQEIEDVFNAQLAYLEGLGWVTQSDDDLLVTTNGQSYIGNISKTFFAKENQNIRQPRAPLN